MRIGLSNNAGSFIPTRCNKFDISAIICGYQIGWKTKCRSY